MSNKTDDMITAIKTTTGGREFVAGNEDIDVAAQRWIDAGFDAESAPTWWEAGCFDADRTAQLRDAGLSPDDVSGMCPRFEGMSWGYAYCNGDVSLQGVLDACE